MRPPACPRGHRGAAAAATAANPAPGSAVGAVLALVAVGALLPTGAAAGDALIADQLASTGGVPLRQRVAAAFRQRSSSSASLRRLPDQPTSRCKAVALRLMPPPSLQKYQKCFQGKLDENSSHDWSVPGAEMDAQIDCWCQNNLTDTIQEYDCCEHDDLYPMCSVECSPDCDGALAQSCIQECPSMCFEATEYVVDEGLCKQCDWTKCWPVMKCLTRHAQARIETGEINRTCHETDFTAGNELRKYWQCWRDAPKHSSHWNVLSSVVHCVCREGMKAHAVENHCCDSLLYGGGVCNLQCLSESACNTQEAQTCINRCQQRCPAYDVAPTRECMEHCLQKDAPCRKFTACRPPTPSTHICDDGRWPEASSGCCTFNRTDGGSGVLLGCPRLCESQHIWRLDGGRAIPWWSRYQPGPGIVAQCTCRDCPETTQEGSLKLGRTVEESIWDNGQMMLVDIARREGLEHGPNRRMQELMVMRNEEILRILEAQNNNGGPHLYHGQQIAGVNDQYTTKITEAASLYGDDGYVSSDQKRERQQDMETNYVVFSVIAGVCTIAIILAIGFATRVVLKRRAETVVTQFQANAQVVIGNPVCPTAAGVDGMPVTGAPVVVAAPTKATSGESPKDLS